ncbi:MAG: DinB family protein [Candidatus Heimdallarchaeota archaeon]
MTEAKAIQLMIWELERGYKQVKHILEIVSKEEAQWQPSSNAKTLETIHQWNVQGNQWLEDGKFDPLSTIEYKVLHLAQCKVMYDEYAFRERTLTWPELECPEWPHSKEYLQKAQLALMASLQKLNDARLEEQVLTNWGEKWPIKQIIAVMIHHDAYHLGQICTVRNLFKMKW